VGHLCGIAAQTGALRKGNAQMHGCSAISALPTPRDLCYYLLGIIGNVDQGGSRAGGQQGASVHGFPIAKFA
jgi:hypothetical protein